MNPFAAAASWQSPFEALLASQAGTPSQSASGLPLDTIIGTPMQDAASWDGAQTAPDDCAIRAQQFIIEQFTGQKLDESALEHEAKADGWYNPGQGGTPPADLGNLLEAHHIPVTHYDHATIGQLAQELAQGHKVLIGVNAEDLWQHDPALQGMVQASGGQGADHAVVVSGIDTSDPNNVRVIVSDPGTGEATASYALSDFLHAWNASDYTMVATKDAAPASLPEMSNFDYSTGHLPTVCGVPYDQFQALEADPAFRQTMFAGSAPTSSSDAFDTTSAGLDFPGVEDPYYNGGAMPFISDGYDEHPHQQLPPGA